MNLKIKSIGISSIASVLIMSLLFTSCATIIGGGPKEKHQRSAEIRWGYFIADLLTTGGLGLIIDFATGAIYQSRYDKTSSLENELKLAIKNGHPGYMVKKDGYYKAEIKDGTIIYNKINEDDIPINVRRSLSKAISSSKTN